MSACVIEVIDRGLFASPLLLFSASMQLCSQLKHMEWPLCVQIRHMELPLRVRAAVWHNQKTCGSTSEEDQAHMLPYGASRLSTFLL